METVGRFIGSTDTVYLSGDGKVLHVSPKIISFLGPDGIETERRQPKEVPANINDGYPVCWTGRKLPKVEAIRKFAFKRTIQLHHTNGLTYDFLFDMAKTLHDEDVVVMMNGTKWKRSINFSSERDTLPTLLEGRVDGERFQLLIHLSNLELKIPQVSKRGECKSS